MTCVDASWTPWVLPVLCDAWSVRLPWLEWCCGSGPGCRRVLTAAPTASAPPTPLLPPRPPQAFVPLSEMFQYVSMLRGMTKGRAQYSMQLDRYEVVPPNIQQDIVSKNKAAATA